LKNIAIMVPTLNKGGAERVAANLSLEFAHYYNVYVIVHDGRDITYPYAGELIDLKLPPTNTFLCKIRTLLRRVFVVRSIKKKYKIDYTISHLPPSNYVNIFSRNGDKVYTYVHSMIKKSKKTWLREAFTGFFSDKVICVSECVRQNMIRNFSISERKAVTVYNFCTQEVCKKSIKIDDGLVIANMGRLSEPKGQWHLIRSMSMVIKECSNIKLVLIGDGDLREALLSLVNQLGLEHHIEFTGFLNNPFERLAEADFYVSSSLWEGLPMALVEAAMCGLPIISTDCDSGCREIIAPDTEVMKKTSEIERALYGILVPVCKNGDMCQLSLTANEEILAKAIILLVKNPDLRAKYQNQAIKRALEFRPEIIMKEWVKLLE